MTREQILNEISVERDYQVEQWGLADEVTNRPADWVLYINRYSSLWLNGFAPYDPETLSDFRTAMVKTAALAVAAIEATDKIISGEIVRNDILKPTNNNTMDINEVMQEMEDDFRFRDIGC